MFTLCRICARAVRTPGVGSPLVTTTASAGAPAVVAASRRPDAPDTSILAPGSIPIAPRAAPMSTEPPATTVPLPTAIASIRLRRS